MAKFKELTDKKNKFRVKLAVGVKDLDSKKYEVEYVEIGFNNESDKQLFTQIFK